MIRLQKLKSCLLILGLFFFVLRFVNSECFIQSEEYIILNYSKNININTSNLPDFNDCVIYIKSDQDLINDSFPGSGSENNPYRIENLLISTVKDYGIYLENTTKYVLIQNCYIYAHYRAIEIYNTTENTITITNNTFTSDNYFGIFASKSHSIKISNNIIYNCYQAIEFNDCPHALIANNTLFDNVRCIRVEYYSPYSQILENNITNNYEVIWLANSGGNFLIKDNLIVSNNFGILLVSTPGPYYPDFCSIIHNLIEAIKWHGLLVESNYNTIFHNSFINNQLEGNSQVKDDGLNNVWYNESLQEGNYWSDWWGFGSYYIDGSAKSYDRFPSELPFHATNTPIPKVFIGRVILILSLCLAYPVFIIISFLIVKKLKKKR